MKVIIRISFVKVAMMIVYLRRWQNMNEENRLKAHEIMVERFGHDTPISLATVDQNIPAVRIVNSYYEEGSFYTITYALSNKIKQIGANPKVAICGEWFTARGIGETLGSVCDSQNKVMTAKLKVAFSDWYYNGHIDESDPNTIILRIRLIDAILFSNGTRYDIDFNIPESS